MSFVGHFMTLDEAVSGGFQVHSFYPRYKVGDTIAMRKISGDFRTLRQEEAWVTLQSRDELDRYYVMVAAATEKPMVVLT